MAEKKEAKVEAPKTQPQAESVQEASVVEYPTATARAIKLGENIYDTNDFLVVIYNDLQKLKKALL